MDYNEMLKRCSNRKDAEEFAKNFLLDGGHTYNNPFKGDPAELFVCACAALTSSSYIKIPDIAQGKMYNQDFETFCDFIRMAFSPEGPKFSKLNEIFNNIAKYEAEAQGVDIDFIKRPDVLKVWDDFVICPEKPAMRVISEVVEIVNKIEKEPVKIEKIDSFRDDNYYLSNFFEAPVEYGGLKFRNNEAAFQAQKCESFEDKKAFCSLNSSEAKKLGRSVNLRKDWEQVKVQVMREVVFAKFEQNPDLAELLLETGDAYLEEGNTWGDRTWGTVNGSGANLLGQILMEVREHLRDFEYSKD